MKMKRDITKPGMPQIWGGIECTINRVGKDMMDQLELAGYYNRGTDMKDILGLGFKAIRYPVLWEKYQPQPGAVIDWSIADKDLSLIRENDTIPIIGLLHHGSGPAFTNLLDDNFPNLFAAYAEKVARHFPWVENYTPINEPLTTARFSGLYGFWHPHKINDVSFAKILLNELKAIVLSMQLIRKIQPAAKLVQTEDLGKTYSTPLLAYQAAFENQRRWLSFDILFGRVNETHPLWNYFMRLGIKAEDLRFFLDNPCTPDIIGVNHYITSERFLDEKLNNYPASTHGGNGIHSYADVEAVRVTVVREPSGLEVLLKEIYARYQTTVGITEVHMHCTREEQLRWLDEVINTAVKLKHAGVDIIAVTAWALLGSHGWNRLLTGGPGEYETGAFDISSGKLRPTAIAAYISGLSRGSHSEMITALLESPGWWKRPERFLTQEKIKQLTVNSRIKPVLIVGKNGTLGKAFSKICTSRYINHVLLGRDNVDICNSGEIENIIRIYDPSCIINTAGYVHVDEAETEKEKCYRENFLGPQKLAILCERYGIKLVSFSSDLVFDGESKVPYKESDAPHALNIYGQSKILAELFLSNVNPSSLIIRTSAFFGPWDKYNFLTNLLTRTSCNEYVEVSTDIIISPTYIPHLVNASLDLLIDDERGIWHLSNKAACSWYEFATMAATYAGINTDFILPVNETLTKAKRPGFSALTSEKYLRCQPWRLLWNNIF